MKRAYFRPCCLLLTLALLLPPLSASAQGEQVPVSGVSIEALTEANRVLEVGDTRTLTAILTPTTATPQSVAWTSSAPENVYVTSTDARAATVTALQPGESIITVTADGKVSQGLGITVSGIVLSASAKTDLLAGNSFTLNKTAYGSARELPATDWSWSSSNVSVARVSTAGAVTGMSAGEAVVTCSSSDRKYTASCKVTVLSSTAQVISVRPEDGRVDFERISDQLASACTSATGGSLNYVTGLLAPTDQGTLYYQYVNSYDTGSGVASSHRFYRSSAIEKLIDRITFVPKSDFAGTAEIRYTGYNASGQSFTGVIEVDVTPKAEIRYISDNGEPIEFLTAEFSQYSQSLYGRPVNYVSFTPPASRYGYLYRNYGGGVVYEGNVSSGDRFYRNSSPAIEDVTFIPADGYTGSFSLSFRGCDTAGNSFSGKVEIEVGSGGSGGADGEISYTTAANRRLHFKTSSFTNASSDITGYPLERVRFTALPDSDEGTLYYDDDLAVTTNASYYRTGSGRLLRDVSFVPKSDFVGTVYIPYTGYNSHGDTFEGGVEIKVGGDTRIEYSVDAGERVYFDLNDFIDASYDATNRQFNYIRFTDLPSTREGILYCGKAKVAVNASYYRTGSGRRLVEDISFVPADSFTGEVLQPFYGYDSSGKRFDGVVAITVGGGSGGSGSSSGGNSTSPQPGQAPISTITYSTSGEPVTFQSWDFTYACSNVLTGGVATVKLSPVDRGAGTLRADYISPMSYNASFDPYAAMPVGNLSRISFIPRADFQGSTQFSYLAADQSGNSFRGVVQVSVSSPGYSRYFNDMGAYAWCARAVDFLKQYNVVQGVTNGAYGPAQPMLRRDFILMLSRAFNLPAAGSVSFPDVPSGSYYAQAVASAKYVGVAAGGDDGLFHPSEPITRQDAALFLYRCMRNRGSITPGSAGDLYAFADRQNVKPAAVEAMAALVREGIFTGTDAGLLAPDALLDRAQMAAILYRALT